MDSPDSPPDTQPEAAPAARTTRTGWRIVGAPDRVAALAAAADEAADAASTRVDRTDDCVYGAQFAAFPRLGVGVVEPFLDAVRVAIARERPEVPLLTLDEPLTLAIGRLAEVR